MKQEEPVTALRRAIAADDFEKAQRLLPPVTAHFAAQLAAAPAPGAAAHTLAVLEQLRCEVAARRAHLQKRLQQFRPRTGGGGAAGRFRAVG